jgi:hypothetical protein
VIVSFCASNPDLESMDLIRLCQKQWSTLGPWMVDRKNPQRRRPVKALPGDWTPFSAIRPYSAVNCKGQWGPISRKSFDWSSSLRILSIAVLNKTGDCKFLRQYIRSIDSKSGLLAQKLTITRLVQYGNRKNPQRRRLEQDG